MKIYIFYTGSSLIKKSSQKTLAVYLNISLKVNGWTDSQTGNQIIEYRY